MLFYPLCPAQACFLTGSAGTTCLNSVSDPSPQLQKGLSSFSYVAGSHILSYPASSYSVSYEKSISSCPLSLVHRELKYQHPRVPKTNKQNETEKQTTSSILLKCLALKTENQYFHDYFLFFEYFEVCFENQS